MPCGEPILEAATYTSATGLSRGLNFAPTPKFIPKAHVVTSVEAAITQSNFTEGKATKAKVGVITALSHVKLPPRNIHPQEAKAAKEIAKNKDVIILLTDKGRAMVVMEHSDYSAKKLTMLGPKELLREQDKQCFAEPELRRSSFW